MTCELCDAWFDAKCVNIKDEAYKVLYELDTCHWYCSQCNVKIGKLIPNMVKLYDKTTEVDNRVTKVENEMKVYNGNALNRIWMTKWPR